MQNVLERLQRAAEVPDEGVDVVRYENGNASDCLREVAPWCLSAGFVPVWAPDDAERDLPPMLRHRHVVIVSAPGESLRTAIRWLRTLARSSSRRHVMLAAAEDQPPLSRSRGSILPINKFAPGDCSLSRRQQRAARWRARGRAQMGARWAIADIETARRRGDIERATALDLELIEDMIGRGYLDDSTRRLHQYLAPGTDWPVYAEAAALRTDVLISRVELAAAGAWASSVVAEANLRHEVVPVTTQLRLAELDFWQGRPMPVSIGRAQHPDEQGWSALRAWTAADAESLTRVSAALGAGAASDGRCEYWRLLIDLLTATRLSPAEVNGRSAALDVIAQSLSRCRLRRRTLVSIAGARALIAGGRQDLMRGAVFPARAIGPEAQAWRRLAAETNSKGPAGWRSTGSDPVGVVALASWRNQMPLVDGLSQLLSVLEESDDEFTVLSGGCEWICRRAGATRAAIVSADGAVLLASEGWRPADLSGEIADVLRGPRRDIRQPCDGECGAFGVSVRSLGATVGHVVVRGRPADRAALQESALMLATLTGPAVRARLDALAAVSRAHHSTPELVGDSPLMASVRDAVVRAASAPFPVLIEGESGTGKELVARALHRLSPRRDRRLNAVNCAALTDELVEAELFGHVRGAFTGAIGPRVGLFEESHGGTLFLDEVTELSPRAQAKLLRVLQEGEIRRVGENQSRAVDVRMLAACNISVADAVASGRFRDDLRFRLAVIRISLPPLRERVEDIPALALTFWRRAASEAGTRAQLGPDALARLTRYSWPGNVRELQNAMAGLVVAAPLRGRVSARHVEQVLSQSAPIGETPGIRLEAARRTFERRVILAALTRHAGRRHAAATELGLTRQGLAKAMRRLGLATDEHAAGVA